MVVFTFNGVKSTYGYVLEGAKINKIDGLPALFKEN